MNEIDEIKKKSLGFRTPENYFENLEQGLLSTFKEREEQEKSRNEQIKLSVWSRLQPYIYLAAMFVGLALFVKVLLPGGTDSPIDGENVTAVVETKLDDEYTLEWDDETYTTYLEEQVAEAYMVAYISE
ncbi:MAG: hypothetical protein Q3998_05790 [Porphyromonas sp.]|nr:hypothetical protein [Porphyromonas sp.]